MAIKILTDKDTNQSVMICNTSEMAFGPVFGEDEDPQEFLEWLNNETKTLVKSGKTNGLESTFVDGAVDARRLSSEFLSDFVDVWRKELEENEAEASGERHFTEPGAWSGGFARNN